MFETVDVWYICKLKSNFEIHVYIQTFESRVKLDEHDLKATVTNVVDKLDLPTRRSIKVSTPPILEMMRFSKKQFLNNESEYVSIIYCFDKLYIYF